MRILHLADLHLGWQPDFLGDKNGERTAERNLLLSRAADFALKRENKIDGVILAGDLFETHRPDRGLLEATLTQLERLVRAEKFVITVPGNHDEVSYRDSVFRLEAARWPGVLALNPNPAELACIERNGRKTAFYGLAYTAGVTRTSPPLHEFPRREAHHHIGVFHGSLDWDTGDRSLPISGDAVARSGYDYLALGHIHKHSLRTLGTVVACYAGAPEAKNFSDPGCGLFTVVTLNDGVRVETANAGCRPCLTRSLDLSYFDSPADLAEEIRSLADSQAMFQLTLTGMANFDTDATVLQQEFAHLFYYFQVESEGVFLHDTLINSLTEEPTIRGYFVRSMREHLRLAESEEERHILRRALRYGVAALRGGAS